MNTVKPVYSRHLAIGTQQTVLIIEVSLFQMLYTFYIVVGLPLTVLIREVSLFQFDCSPR